MVDKTILVVTSIIIGLLLVGGLGYFGFTRQSVVSAPSGEYIQAPVFMYYECSPAQEKVNGKWASIPKTGGSISCPVSTDECDLDIRGTALSSVFDDKVTYNICSKTSSFCKGERQITLTSSNPIISIPNILKSEKVVVSGCTGFLCLKDLEGLETRANFKPFILWKVGIFSGGRTEYTTQEQGCTFPTQDRGNLIDRINNFILPNSETSIDDATLPPFKTRNFIETFVPLSKENVNFVEYSGQEGYCLARDIYSITEVKTNSATYQVVDGNFNKIIKQGVDCCPNEREPTRKCNSDFEWESITPTGEGDDLEGGECSAFNPCAGIEWFPSGSAMELNRFNCEEGLCVKKTRNVECTSNSDCLGNSKGSVCDTKIWECVDVAPPDVVDVGDNGDDVGEDECGAWVKVAGKTIVPDLFCVINKFTLKFRLILSGIVGLLGGLLSIAFVRNLTRRKPFKKVWWIFLVTFLVLGGGLFFLALIFFWWILIALVIIGSVKAFVPGV